MLVHATLSAENLRCGIPISCWECPFALAVKDAIPAAYDIQVTNVDVTISLAGQHLRAMTSEAVERAITDIDQGNVVHPFSFDLDFQPRTPTKFD
jgi:hypothetical protein